MIIINNMDYLENLISKELSPEIYRIIDFYYSGKDAMILHNNFNQKYVGKPYILHLYFVHNKLIKNLTHIPKQDHDIIISAGWLHDTVEDCKITHGYIENKHGYYVSLLVKALTNKKDGNPNYKLLLKERYGRLIKLADRVSHLESNFTIIEYTYLFEKEGKNNLVKDAKKYLLKYLNQNEQFIDGLKLNEPVFPFEYELLKEYLKLMKIIKLNENELI